MEQIGVDANERHFISDFVASKRIGEATSYYSYTSIAHASHATHPLLTLLTMSHRIHTLLAVTLDIDTQ